MFDNIVFKANKSVMNLMCLLTGFYTPGWRNRKTEVKGEVKAGYEPVKKAFQDLYDLTMDSQSQVCVYVGDECVVDLYGDSKDSGLYDRNSL
jgi:hypothetical protein